MVFRQSGVFYGWRDFPMLYIDRYIPGGPTQQAFRRGQWFAVVWVYEAPVPWSGSSVVVSGKL